MNSAIAKVNVIIIEMVQEEGGEFADDKDATVVDDGRGRGDDENP